MAKSTLAPYWKRYAVEILKDIKARQEWNRRRRCEFSERPRYRDQDDDYCIHGTFIGDPYGPDYMCGWCEDGVSLYEYALGIAYNNQHRAVREFQLAAFRAICDVIPTSGDLTPEKLSLIPDVEITRVVDAFAVLSGRKAVSASR